VLVLVLAARDDSQPGHSLRVLEGVGGEDLVRVRVRVRERVYVLGLELRLDGVERRVRVGVGCLRITLVATPGRVREGGLRVVLRRLAVCVILDMETAASVSTTASCSCSNDCDCDCCFAKGAH